MFKRSTKLTALLVAAASVASTVPAMAATKLGNKNGTVENAVAFKDGKYLYEGYRTEDSDQGIYYNTGDNDKMVDDAVNITGKYDKSKVFAKDGSDEYVIDLETGKSSSDDTEKELDSTAENKIESKLQKTDRYGNGVNITDDNFERVTKDQFGDVWYSYKAELNSDEYGTGKNGFGYIKSNGTYIDCSYDLNLYVYYNPTTGSQIKDDKHYSASKGEMHKIEDVEDKVKVTTDKDGKDVKAEVTNIDYVGFLGQDEKYLYSVIKVNIKNVMDLKRDDEYNKEDTNGSIDRYYIQKVSKETGDKEKGAYKPKSTECYELTPYADNGDLKDAFDAILDAGKLKGDTDFRVVDGAVYATFRDDEKVKTIKIGLKNSEKLKVSHSSASTDKVSGRVAKKDGDKDTKADAWSIDVNGTVWAIYNGDIKKSAKIGDFETVYTCDRSLDRIDVYDENSLIAWASDGDVYTTIDEGSKAAKEEAEQIAGKQEQQQATTEPAVTAKTGWDKLADGTWNYYDATGKKVTGWTQDNGVWYYLDPTTAVMKTGWIQDAGNWYYLNASGAMQTGWVQDGSTWYYCNNSGAMLASQWFQDGDGRWYYLTQSGAMAVNTTIDGYVLGANGAWVK